MRRLRRLEANVFAIFLALAMFLAASIVNWEGGGVKGSPSLQLERVYASLEARIR